MCILRGGALRGSDDVEASVHEERCRNMKVSYKDVEDRHLLGMIIAMLNDLGLRDEMRLRLDAD